MGESIGLRNLVQERRVEMVIRDLRGLMRGLLERTAQNMKTKTVPIKTTEE